MIKKLAVILLLIVTSVFSAGCWLLRDLPYQYKFFSKEVLEKYWVPDLPRLQVGADTRCSSGIGVRNFYCTLDKNAYMEYVENVYTYLKAHFKYVGIRVRLSMTTEQFLTSDDLLDYRYEFEHPENGKGISYDFIYGNELFQQNERGPTLLNWKGISIIRWEDSPSNDWKNFSYNVNVQLFHTVMSYEVKI